MNKHQERSGFRLVLLTAIAFLTIAAMPFAAGSATIDFPAANAIVSGSVTVGVTTTTTNSVSMYYQLTGTSTWTLLGAATNESTTNDTWNYTWATTALSDGNYTLNASATNNTENFSDTNTNIYVNNTAYTVTITSAGGVVNTIAYPLTVTTDENSTCRYSGGPVAYTSMSGTMTPATDGTTHSASVANSWGASISIYVGCKSNWYGSHVSDYGNDSVSIQSLASGGLVTPMWKKEGTSATVQNRITVSVKNTGEDSAIATITKEEQQSMFGITEVQVSTQAGTATVKIEKKEAGPGGIDGTVYRYLDISINTGTSEVSSGTVKFKVEKAWYTNNGVDHTTTKLYRYVDGAWTALPTTMTTSDDTYYHFEATTPGFSDFAIVATTPPVVCTEGATQACTTADNCPGTQTCANNAWTACVDTPNDNCPAVTTPSTGGEEPTTGGEVEAAGFDYTWIILIIIIIVIIAVAVSFSRRKQYPITAKK